MVHKKKSSRTKRYESLALEVSSAFDGNLVVAASNFTDFSRFPNLETVPTKQGNNTVRSMGMRYRRRRTPGQTGRDEECWRNGERNEHAKGGGWQTFKPRRKEWMRERERPGSCLVPFYLLPRERISSAERKWRKAAEKRGRRESVGLWSIHGRITGFLAPRPGGIFFFFLFCIQSGLQLGAQLMGHTHESRVAHFSHPSSRSGDSFVDVRL